MEKTKAALALATLLVHPTPDARTTVMVNPPSLAVDATIQQQVDGVWTPLSFLSKNLSAEGDKKSTLGSDLLAAYLVISTSVTFWKAAYFLWWELIYLARIPSSVDTQTLSPRKSSNFCTSHNIRQM